MSIGFTPKYSEDVSPGNLSREMYLVAAGEAATSLGWTILYRSENGLVARTNNGMFRFNARVTVTIYEDRVNLLSESVGNEMIDWNKNKKTVALFSTTFRQLSSSSSVEELAQKYAAIQPTLTPDEDDVLIHPEKNTNGFLSLFVPREGYYITHFDRPEYFDLYPDGAIWSKYFVA